MNADGEDGVAGYIAAWRPSAAPPRAAAFARQVVTAAAPAGRERAKNLLWAAGKLAAYGIGLGLDQRLGDITATLQPGDEAEAVALLGRSSR